uniref:Uncharacterized protein n=1 Tax=Romanomermis culicivorax TaxID=13658 RepID=A0A915I6W0_ROMCU
MDVEPTIPKSARGPMSWMTTALTLVSPTTATLTTATTTLTAATISTAPTESRLVIATHPISGAIPPGGIDLQLELQLPSATITLPNYVCFCTTDLPHWITLAMLPYLPHIDLNVEFFSPHTLHEMVLINLLVASEFMLPWQSTSEPQMPH